MSGRFKATSAEMRSFIGHIRSDEPERFNDEVAIAVAELRPDAIVRSRVTQIGGRKLVRENGEVIGDVDVLLIDARAKRVVAIEVKDLNFARNAMELASECENLLVGEKCAVVHHTERTEWLRNNLEHVVTSFGQPWRGRWAVVPAIVTSQELMSPLFQGSPIEVVAFDYLEDALRRFLK